MSDRSAFTEDAMAQQTTTNICHGELGGKSLYGYKEKALGSDGTPGLIF